MFLVFSSTKRRGRFSARRRYPIPGRPHHFLPLPSRVPLPELVNTTFSALTKVMHSDTLPSPSFGQSFVLSLNFRVPSKLKLQIVGGNQVKVRLTIGGDDYISMWCIDVGYLPCDRPFPLIHNFIILTLWSRRANRGRQFHP